jgi:hypothetical protein
MKVWMLAGLFTVATIPFAAAAETDAECQVDDTRRVAAQVRIDGGSSGGSAPAPAATTARQTSTPRPAEQMAQRTPAPEAVEPTETARTTAQPRRRNGKRIPDAELIGPRGAL